MLGVNWMDRILVPYCDSIRYLRKYLKLSKLSPIFLIIFTYEVIDLSYIKTEGIEKFSGESSVRRTPISYFLVPKCFRAA